VGASNDGATFGPIQTRTELPIDSEFDSRWLWRRGLRQRGLAARIRSMSGAQTLSETMTKLRRKLRAPFCTLHDDLVTRLTQAATAESALKEDDAFPDASPDADGKFVLSSNPLKSAPLVINYRGQRCPSCAALMAAMSAAALRYRMEPQDIRVGGEPGVRAAESLKRAARRRL
jgi:hypothetical protein